MRGGLFIQTNISDFICGKIFISNETFFHFQSRSCGNLRTEQQYFEVYLLIPLAQVAILSFSIKYINWLLTQGSFVSFLIILQQTE